MSVYTAHLAYTEHSKHGKRLVMLKNHAPIKNIIPLFQEPYVTIEEMELRLALERRALIKLGETQAARPKPNLIFVTGAPESAERFNVALLLISALCVGVSLALFAIL